MPVVIRISDWGIKGATAYVARADVDKAALYAVYLSALERTKQATFSGLMFLSLAQAIAELPPGTALPIW